MKSTGCIWAWWLENEAKTYPTANTGGFIGFKMTVKTRELETVIRIMGNISNAKFIMRLYELIVGVPDSFVLNCPYTKTTV